MKCPLSPPRDLCKSPVILSLSKDLGRGGTSVVWLQTEVKTCPSLLAVWVAPTPQRRDFCKGVLRGRGPMRMGTFTHVQRGEGPLAVPDEADPQPLMKPIHSSWRSRSIVRSEPHPPFVVPAERGAANHE